MIQDHSFASTEPTQSVHMPSGFKGVDAMFGGGIPGPAVILLAGAPGVGKTTLALQIAARIGADRTLYASGDAPSRHLQHTAHRLGLADEANRMVPVGEPGAIDLTYVRGLAAGLGRRLVVIDSLREAYDTARARPSTQGEILRLAGSLYEDAHANDRTYVLITSIGGGADVTVLRALEYVVDVSARLSKSRKANECTLHCPQKNRFGSTEPQVRLALDQHGFREVV